MIVLSIAIHSRDCSQYVIPKRRHGFDDNPVEIFWLKIAKGNIRKHRESGKQDDRVELSYIESSMAYGIKYKKLKDGEFEIKFHALPKWSVILKMCPKEGRPKLFGDLNGLECCLKRIHVTLKKQKSWYVHSCQLNQNVNL